MWPDSRRFNTCSAAEWERTVTLPLATMKLLQETPNKRKVKVTTKALIVLEITLIDNAVPAKKTSLAKCIKGNGYDIFFPSSC